MRICIQSLENVLLSAKKYFLVKYSIWVLKNAEFHAKRAKNGSKIEKHIF
jgi:hypothetical protein